MTSSAITAGSASGATETQSPDGMVERVARALARGAYVRAVASAGAAVHAQWSDEREYVEDRWPKYVDDARAAIEAMRTPTEGMLAAATPSHRMVGVAPGYSVRVEQLGSSPGNNWRQMIDAALSSEALTPPNARL